MMQRGKVVLILGGGVMQLPAITAARRLGCSVHVADRDRDCPGAGRADVFHHVDLSDEYLIVKTARSIRDLAGVFTAGTDFSTSVARVAGDLGLPGIPYEVSRNATDKGQMRRTLQNAGIAVPRFVEIDDPAHAETRTRTLCFPVVVKPVDNMGSRGVQRVADAGELDHAIAGALAWSRQKKAIVEEFISGTEYSLDAIVMEEAIYITGIAERHIFFPPYFVEMGHTIPAQLEEKEATVLSEAFKQAIRALGITRGAAKGDLFLDRSEKKPKGVVGEVAARLSGGYMSGWTFPLATGIPLSEIGIRVALGETPQQALFTPSHHAYVAERALISPPGTVVSVEVPRTTSEEVKELFIRCKPGERVRPPSNNVEKIANAIARAPTPREAEEHALTVLDQVIVHLAPGDDETERFLYTAQGAGVFRTYRPASPAVQDAVDRMPWYTGTPGELCDAIQSTGKVPVITPTVEVSRKPPALWSACYPVRAADDVLDDLLHRGLFTFVSPDQPAFGKAFWTAFSAGGRQGAVYLYDCAVHGYIPMERAL